MSVELETPEINLSEVFLDILSKGDMHLLKKFLDEQNISDVVELVNEFPENEATIIDNMTVHRAVSVFKILDINQQKDIIKELPARKTAKILNELPPDDRTDFLEELPKAAIRDLIKLLDPEERKITLSLLGYPEDSVGRLMTPDYVYVYPHYTVTQVLDTIRKYGKNSETIDVIYIIDEKGGLIDDIRIRDLLLAKPEDIISDIIDGRFVALNVYDDQEHASQVFKMNNRTAIPVVDDNDVLLGIVTIDDILWVTNEEFSEDMQKMGGTEALNEPYLDISIFKLFKKRITWLVVLFFGEMFTATAMGYFQDELAKVLVLASFIPLILSTGGNTGSQSSTLIIQAMSVGEITITDWLKILRREITSGLLLGVLLGIIGFFRVTIWHMIAPGFYGPHWMLIAVTIGFTIVGVVIWGTITGSMLPIVLKKLGADPAVSSAPFVATLVDVTAILIYFSLAYLFLQGTLL
ncbi:MAG: magnesium transporter [Chitinophagia bacterium]|jgi:magnesium transporter|nr:magnesium transporter [Chitinophagia bacterium]NCA29329.1 magnesium transporter [Chitinophagia bacterium]